MHTSATTLQTLNAVHHSAQRLISGDHFSTHHCNLYQNIGWPSLAVRRKKHLLLFSYKGLLNKLPFYLTLLTFRNISYSTRSLDWITLEVPLIKSAFGSNAFSFFSPPQLWNKMQGSLKLDTFLSLQSFKLLLEDYVIEQRSPTPGPRTGTGAHRKNK